MSLDKYSGQEWTLRGYARLWQWSTGKVSRFIDEIGFDLEYETTIKNEQNGVTEARQQRDSDETVKSPKNNILQLVTKQQRDSDETATKRTNKKRKEEYTFNTFWTAYPKKKSKAEAYKIWKRLNPAPDLVSKILAALDWQQHQPDWQKSAGQFIPHPTTWLNQQRWEDERQMTPPPSAPTNGGTLEALRAKGIDI